MTLQQHKKDIYIYIHIYAYHVGSKLFCILFSSQLILPATSGAYLHTCYQRCLLAGPTRCQRLTMANLPCDSDGFQWKLRRMVDRVVEFVEARTTKPYPKTNVALQSLRAAMSDEMPQKRTRRTKGQGALLSAARRKRIFSDIDSTAKKHYDKRRRLQKENEGLRANLAKHTVFRSGAHNHIVPHWLVRVFLSQPNPSARGMEKSVRDVAGMDAPVISRKSIERIRDAWITMYKPMVLKIAADRLKTVVAGATHDARVAGSCSFVCVWFLQVQDEADLKLRIREDDGHDVLRRSRASKVQQNVLSILDMHGCLDIPTELEALGDKTAATLATSFERLLRSTVSAVLPATCGVALPATVGEALLPAATPEIW